MSAMCCQPSADSPSSSLPGSFPLSVLYLHESTRLCLSAGTNLSLCLQWNLSNVDTIEPLKCVLIREVSSFQGANNTHLYVGIWSSVLIREVSPFQGSPLGGVPLYRRVPVLLMTSVVETISPSRNASACLV